MIARAALSLLLLAASRDDPLAGRVAGAPAECLEQSRVQGPDIVDRHTILYRQSRQRIWRTGPIGACGSMRSGDMLIVTVHGNRICRNDRFQVRSNNVVLGAPCRFDRFVPYDTAP